MESLTVHYLARELHDAWNGRRVACFAIGARPAFVLVGATGAPTVRFDLSRPAVRVHHAVPTKERGPLDGYEIVAVDAPIDERRIVVHLTKPGKFRGSAAREAQLLISVVPNARGAALVSADGHRFGAAGSPVPPVGAPRPVLSEPALRAAAAAADATTLMTGRWIGPRVAAWLIADPASAVQRYARILELPAAEPVRCDGDLLPFPLCDAPESAESLIEPAAEARSGMRVAREDPRRKAIDRMRDQIERAREAPRLRAAADALMALAEGAAVPPSLTLPDGSPFGLSVRAGEAAPAVAERLYAKARAMERARVALPGRIARLEEEIATTVPREPGARDEAPAVEPRRSYKRFTSRGGLEIRVGRSAKDNDALTFHDSSPDDVWMHASGASGSHVVLRWTRQEAPPAADLEEAALLAAWHSRARGSTVVPVDWTRRRYVRKPRGAAPGSVIVSQARTVFVRPSAAAVRAIRDRS